MKITTRGRHLWMRTIGSTVVGQCADSGVFIFLAFYGTVPLDALAKMAGAQWLMKSAYEALATPLTYLTVTFLKRAERKTSMTDRRTSIRCDGGNDVLVSG